MNEKKMIGRPLFKLDEKTIKVIIEKIKANRYILA